MERTTLSAFATRIQDIVSGQSPRDRDSRWFRHGLIGLIALIVSIAAEAQIAVPYTASGTFTPPTGVTQVTVECWGGGGRGSTRSTSGQGGGGGGGAYARSTVTVFPGTPYTVTVGAGSTNASPGGDSWFGSTSTVLAKGGNSAADNSNSGATGGSAASSVGTVKFNGGNGATTVSSNSGGGGSSAGTAANGANGAVTAGGTAPAGGGDGGDGVTSSNGNGGDGSFPGGGGGGAKRSSGTRTGGDGGAGFVRVTYTYTAGSCASASDATAIPDNTCGTASFTVSIPVSGLPTSLGSSPGNAQLSSVGLIISHTYNSDLDITLTSPSGVTRNLILDRFGSGDNLGNPSNCPSSALILQDGGTGLSNTNTSNVTGTFDPEQSLAGFTGNPNGTWILSICDDANLDLGNFRYLSLDFCTVPSTANAGPDQGICGNQTATLAANNPTYGTGAWSVVSGPSTSSAQFSSIAANNAVFTPAGGTGTYTLRWTISNGSCSASTDDVIITVQPQAAAPTMAPTSAAICSGGSVVLTASAPDLSITKTGGSVSIVNGGSSPYPSTFSISGWPTSGVTVTSVTLNGMLHNNPTDIDILLRSPNGTNVVLMSDVGGTANLTGNDYTFQDGAGAMTGSFNPSGTYAPTNSGSSDTYTTLGTVTQSTPALSSFSGNPNGTWGLYAMDDNNNGTNGSLTGWSVTFNVPVTYAWAPATGLSGTTGTTVTCSATSSQTYTVTVTNPETGCQNTNTVSVNVANPPTTANAGADQSICSSPGSATMAGNSPSSGSGTWTQVAGPLSASITTATSPTTTINGMTAAGTYTFRWTIANSPCTDSFDEVDVVVSGCTYYSQGSGDVSDPIWNLSPVGTPGPAVFGAGTGMVIQSGHTVTNDASHAIGDLTVDNGGTLVLDAFNTLSVNGSAAINGALNANDDSELALVGAVATTITLASTTSFYDLTVNTPSGTTLNGTAHIRGTLLLQDGAFDCTGYPVVLRSTATYTGRLGPVAPTASYTGNMRIERYVPAGATNWRLIGSPIVGRKVNHLQDDFFTAGYPGSAYPNFYDPPSSGIFWPSVRWYDETNTGSNVNDGLLGVTSNNQSLNPGQGFAAWCGTNLTTTTAFTIDLENNAPVIASSPISLPMTYTNTGNPSVDGWNLVANPLPSPIAFDQIARGADVEDYVTFFDPATGNMATWDISLNAGTNGGTNTIQSMQGFYLKASGPAVTTTVDESDKVAGNSGGFFGGTEEAPAMVSLHISSAINSFSDETLLLFSQGTPVVDGDDVPKMMFAHPQAPQVATQGSTGVPLAINAYGPYSADVTIPVLVQAGVAGTYTISVTGVESAGLSCLKLEDLVTSTITPLSEGSSYTFDLATGDGMSAPRFLLHATAPLNVLAQGPACFGGADGDAEVDLGEEFANVLWLNDMGQTLLEQSNVTGPATIEGLGHGDYQVLVSGYKGCEALSTVFSVTEPNELLIDATVIEASCPDTEDGGVELVISGGDAPYGVLWSTGASSLDLSAGPGSYTAVVSDANGCEIAIGGFTVVSGPAPEAMASVLSTTVLAGEEVQFTCTSDDASTFTWDFGDGATSEEQNPQHVYDAPGTFQVSLTVSNGACSNSTVIEMTVEVSTAVTEMSMGSISAWLNGENLVVEHGFADQYPLLLEVMNEAGQLHQQYRVAGPAGRLTIPAAELSSGIWYLRVSNQEMRRTIPVVVVR